jgi:hypothetical protein
MDRIALVKSIRESGKDVAGHDRVRLPIEHAVGRWPSRFLTKPKFTTSAIINRVLETARKMARSEILQGSFQQRRADRDRPLPPLNHCSAGLIASACQPWPADDHRRFKDQRPPRPGGDMVLIQIASCTRRDPRL